MNINSIFFLIILFLPISLAAPTYCNPNLPNANGCAAPTVTTSPTAVNYSAQNVNNSLYWQGHTGTDGSWLTGLWTNHTNIAMTNKTNIFNANQKITGALNISGQTLMGGQTNIVGASGSASPFSIGGGGFLVSGAGYPDFEFAQNLFISGVNWWCNHPEGSKVAMYNGGFVFSNTVGNTCSALVPKIIDVAFRDLLSINYPTDDGSIKLGDLIGTAYGGFILQILQSGRMTWSGIFDAVNVSTTEAITSTGYGQFIKTSNVWDYFIAYQEYLGTGNYSFGDTIYYKAYAVSYDGIFDETPQETSCLIDDQGAEENDNCWLEGTTSVGGDRFVFLRSLDGGVTYPYYFDMGTGAGGGFGFEDDGQIWTIGTIDVSNNEPMTTLINKDGFGLYTNRDVNFTKTSYLNNVIISGNLSVKRPYGMFSSTQTQTIAVGNTPYPITFNWTEDSYYITKSSDNANFSFLQTGDYLIELSAVVVTDTNNKHAEIWVQKTNSSGTMVNIPRSNTKLEIPNAGAEQVIAVPFIIDMLSTDKFRVMYASDDAGTQLLYTTNTSYSPETPSIIMTITKISETTP